MVGLDRSTIIVFGINSNVILCVLTVQDCLANVDDVSLKPRLLNWSSFGQQEPQRNVSLHFWRTSLRRTQNNRNTNTPVSVLQIQNTKLKIKLCPSMAKNPTTHVTPTNMAIVAACLVWAVAVSIFRRSLRIMVTFGLVKLIRYTIDR